MALTPPEGGPLPPCPASPNCVGSDEAAGPRHVAPLRLRHGAGGAAAGGEPVHGGAAGMARLRAAVEEVVTSFPRARVTGGAGARVTAEFRSRLFGFVDDVLLEIRPGRGEIAVRSASRLGYWDLGANRRRVEAIRARLRERGIVE